jgi:deoxyxylulose-5-phosphate synthase
MTGGQFMCLSFFVDQQLSRTIRTTLKALENLRTHRVLKWFPSGMQVDMDNGFVEWGGKCQMVNIQFRWELIYQTWRHRVTIVSFGKIIKEAHIAADELAKEGISCEIVDLRTVRPMDYETILTSVRKQID